MQTNATRSFPLETPVQYLKGVGPYYAKLLATRRIHTVGDLLHCFPHRYVDRRRIDSIHDAQSGKDKTVIGKVVSQGLIYTPRGRRKIFELVVEDGTGVLSAKWFNYYRDYMEKRYSAGTTILLSGEITMYRGQKQIVHPEIEIIEDDDIDQHDVGGRILPIYPLTEGLGQKTMRTLINNAWGKYGEFIQNQLPDGFLKKCNLMHTKDALQEIHFPSNEQDVDLLNLQKSAPHKSLIFEELFFLELGLGFRRKAYIEEAGVAHDISLEKHKELLDKLPFDLTNAQTRSIDEIFKDMAKPNPMNRLLQGDVGSGKTVVALSACWQAIGSGYQAAMMAPTEILAEQHFETIKKISENLDIKVVLLTGSTKAKDKEEIYNQISKGEVELVVGTHALIQEGVQFNRLGLVIIDEQHRFGVKQRSALKEKGVMPDILVMTATPIPRTLAMTVYGDLDISIIDELPKGRKPVSTKIYTDKQRGKLYQGIQKELENGRQVYVIYPLVEESEKIDLKNATDMSEHLTEVFGPKYLVSLLHGRMKGEEKERIMGEFKRGEVHILASTSVVEVGVDVPNATVMAIEHAERFGLSQLHQLRGRVGRSDIQSYCILMTNYKKSKEAMKRLDIMTKTNDGFRIAEEDLAIRGPGEVLGARQSGLPDFELANLARDVGVLKLARERAMEIIQTDPLLKEPDNAYIRHSFMESWQERLKLADVG